MVKASGTEKTHVPSPLRRRSQRLALAGFSLIATILALEILARVLPEPAPTHLRDGIYSSQLPTVNGRNSWESPNGLRLPEAKRPGEIRIFVFGESSVEGAPWRSYGSPPTFLYDQLASDKPHRDITVVNMGRASSYSRDTWYFLLSIRRFSPDFIVFYLGMNDEFSIDEEMCLPENHPQLFSVWRWLATHSRLAWSLRARGRPAFMRFAFGDHGRQSPDAQSDLCDARKAFDDWTHVLVETAKDTQAKVIVTSPVENPLQWAENSAEWGVDKSISAATKSASYQRVLACALTPQCDTRAVMETERLLGDSHDHLRVLGRQQAWQRTAAEEHVRLIDLDATFAQQKDQVRRPLFAEQLHLTLDGYWLLAALWADQLREAFGDHAQRNLVLAPAARAAYVRQVEEREHQTMACVFLRCANDYLRIDHLLIGAALLVQAATVEDVDPPQNKAGRVANLLRFWLQRQIDPKAQVPERYGSLLPSVDPATVTQDLRAHPDCDDFSSAKWAHALDAEAAPRRAPQAPPPTQAVVEHGITNAEFVIPSGQDALIGAMLDVTPTDASACAVGAITVQAKSILAEYACKDGQTVKVTLQHRAIAGEVSARTQRFAISVARPRSSETWFLDLVQRIRNQESAFVWRAAQVRAVPVAAPSKRQWPSGLAFGILLASVLVAALAIWRWRSKK